MIEELDLAVRRVYEFKKKNPTWAIGFIVSKVSDLNKISFEALFREIIRRNKMRKKKLIIESTPNKGDNPFYNIYVSETRKLGKREPKENDNIPWWNKD